MVQTLLLVAAALAVRSVSAACTRTAVAKPGDTCATFSSANAITVQQLLTNNPTVSGCTLTAGLAYCIATDGGPGVYTPTVAANQPAPTSTRPGGAAPTGSLIPSPDGSDGVCGGQYTCLGSVYGDCCSANGYCGNTTEYCQDACNPAFGRCGGGSAPVPSSGGGSPTTTVTVTVGGGGPVITSIVTVTRTASTVSVTVTRTVSATPSSPAKPSPLQPGTYAQCKTYYQFKRTDNCRTIARTYGISLDTLYEYNPNFDCDDPYDMAGYYICVG